ncbi:hypothetical protein ACWEPM_12150 [Streptomyces sp. NPDC004244]
MTSLFERLDAEEAIVRGELSALREKVAVAEERLVHLTITRETLISLASDQDDKPGPEAGEQAAGGEPSSGGGADFTTHGTEEPTERPTPARPLEWEVARERILVLLAGAGRAMKVQDIAAAIGEDTSSTLNGRRVETTRSRLKRLAKEGQLVEGPIAWFAVAPAASASGEEGAATG